MKPSEQKRFDRQYLRHLKTLELQGMSDSTIDVYARVNRDRHDLIIFSLAFPSVAVSHAFLKEALPHPGNGYYPTPNPYWCSP